MKTLKKIKVTPLAGESMGVRSMCVKVETPDIKLLIDPGCALGPFRNNLAPHPLEYKQLINLKEKILESSKTVDLLILSHYHHDHFCPKLTDYFTIYANPEIFEQLYTNKIILTKNPEEFCSKNGTFRGREFIKQSEKISDSVKISDNKTIQEGDTIISFSKPVPHGEFNSPNGVIMTAIKYQEEIILHSSDVQGPLLNETTKKIIDINPNLAIIGGPPIYLNFFQKNVAYKVNAVNNMIKIMEKIPISIFDHHLLRMGDWKIYCKKIIENIGKQFDGIQTFASFLGEKESLLEATRKEIYNRYPISQEFKNWLSLNENSRKRTLPPLGF